MIECLNLLQLISAIALENSAIAFFCSFFLTQILTVESEPQVGPKTTQRIAAISVN